MIVNYDKNNGLSYIWDNLKKSIPKVSEEASSFFDKTKNWNLNSFSNSYNGFDDLIKKLNISDESLKAFLDDTNYAEKSLSSYQTYLASTTKQTSIFAKATKGAKTMLKSLGALAANIGVSMLASFAIGKAIEGIDSIIHEKENAIEKAQEAQQSISNNQATYNNNTSYVNDNIDRYEKLSSGVSKYGENLSLTVEEFAEFNQMSNEIGQMFPELVSGYTATGDAILTCADNADTLTEALKKQHEEFNKQTIDSSADLLEGYLASTNEGNFWGNKDSKNNQIRLLQNLLEGKWDIYSTADFTTPNKAERHTLLDAGVDIPWFISMDGIKEKFEENRDSVQRRVASLVDDVNKETDKLRPITQAMLEENDDFKQFDDNIQTAISSVIKNFDSDWYTNMAMLSNGKSDYFQDHIDEMVKEIKDSPDITGAFQNLYEMDFNEGSATENLKKAQAYIDTITSGSSLFTEDDLKVSLGIDIKEEEITAAINKLKNIAKIDTSKELDSAQQNILSWINSLNEEDLKIIVSPEFENTAITTELGKGNVYDSLSDMPFQIIQEDFISYKQSSVPTSNFEEVSTQVENYTASIMKLQEVLGAQTTGTGIALEDYNDTTLKDYQDTLEYVNGTMQINEERAKEIADAKAKETLAVIKANKAQTQTKYTQNAKELRTLQNALGNYTDATDKNAIAIQARIDALNSDQATLSSYANQYDIMAASIRNATGAYQEWVLGQNQPESGDMARDVNTAIDQMMEYYDPESANYHRFNKDGFQNGLAFLVPEDVPEEDVKAYLEKVATYFDGEAGATKFVDQAIDKQLMDYNPDTGSVKVAAGKTMKDFAEAFHWTDDTMMAMFGNLQEFRDWGFDWSDENITSYEDALAELDETAAGYQEKIDEINEKPIKTPTDYQELEFYKQQLESVNKLRTELNEEAGNQGVKDYLALEDRETEATEELNALYEKKRIGIPVDQSEIDAAYDKLNSILEEKEKLGEPTIIEVDAFIESADESLASYKEELQSLQKDKNIQIQAGIEVPQEELDRIEELKQLIRGTEGEKQAAIELKATLNTTEYDNTMTEIQNDTIDDKNFSVNAIDNASPILFRIHNGLRQIQDKSFTVTTITHTVDGGTESGSGPNKLDGTAQSNGAAQLNGTAWASTYTGLAYADGNWASKTSGTTLVGELGPEIVVDPSTGRWHTVGNFGAEFVDLPKGAIVFNHLQSQALLDRGHVMGRGAAKVMGTAFSGRAMLDGGLVDGYEKGSGTFGSKYDSGNATNINSNTAAVAQNTQAVEENTEKEAQTINWIERLTNSLSKMRDAMDTFAKDILQTYRNQNTALDKLINRSQKDVGVLNKTSEYYAKKAAASGLSNAYQKKVREGTIALEDITDETLKKQIDDFTELYDKSVQLSDEAQQLKQDIRDLQMLKLDNIEDDFDRIISYQDTMISNIQSINDLTEKQGIDIAISNYDEMISHQNEIIAYLNGKSQELQKQFNALIDNGVIRENTDDWWDWKEKIQGVQSELNNSRGEIEELNDSIREIRWKGFEDGITKLEELSDELDFMSDKISDDAIFMDGGKLTDSGYAKIALVGQQLTNAKQKAEEYKIAIAALGQEYKNGVISQRQYEEELSEYRKEQRSAINDVKQYKDALVDLVKNGIDKQTEAMEKYIDTRKKEISLSKNSEDYQRQVSDKTKQINSIKAQMSTISNDDSAASKAKYKALNEDLLKLTDELEELKKDHANQILSNSLDEQLDKIQENADAQKELLDTNLEEQSNAINEMLGQAKENYASVYNELNLLAEAYGVQLSSDIVSPWQNAEAAVQAYKDAVASASTTAAGQSSMQSNTQINTDKQQQATNNTAYTPPANETTDIGGMWKKNTKGWWYEHGDGSYTTNGWEEVDGKKYHFDKEGYMQKGWIKDGSDWYYLNPSGDMATNKWVKSANGKDWYYLGNDGKMAENQMINSKGKDYYLASGGKMKTGWFKLGSEWYYANSSGALQKNQWVKAANGKDWYYVGADGIMLANTSATIDGKNSRFDKNGRWLGYFAKGAKDISNLKGYGVVGEDGNEELIATKGGQLMQLDNAKMIFNNEQTQRLWELSKAMEGEQMKQLFNLSVPDYSSIPTAEFTPNPVTVESLYTINVDTITKDSLPQLEKLLDEKTARLKKDIRNDLYQGLSFKTGRK